MFEKVSKDTHLYLSVFRENWHICLFMDYMELDAHKAPHLRHTVEESYFKDNGQMDKLYTYVLE